jgi:hypothetical protein
MFLLNAGTSGDYIVQKPETRPSSDTIIRRTGLLITPEAKHKEYKNTDTQRIQIYKVHLLQ